ncbi:hypothetical protein BURKHO8Y_140360 [Burkholderia sp. 8Y]|nr:hypothetical protein BURKHO8Y_140360 [Burkholderia sp. 8Y]
MARVSGRRGRAVRREIDEFAMHKGHRYATLVVNRINRQVLWIGPGRSRETARAFFEQLPECVAARIGAVAIDMTTACDCCAGAQNPHGDRRTSGFPPVTVPLVIDGVAVQTFDGAGGGTTQNVLIVSGTSAPGAASGFNPNEVLSTPRTRIALAKCASPTIQSGASIDEKFVIVNDGNEMSGVTSAQHLPGCPSCGRWHTLRQGL